MTVVLVVAVAVAGVAVYLWATTPRAGEPLRFPIPTEQRDLLSRVPAGAEAFALIPSAGLLQVKLLANPVARESVLRWTAEHELPRAWMLGRADVVVWKESGTTTYAVRLDRFRAAILRLWLMVSSNADARWEGSTLIMNAAPAMQQSDTQTPVDLEPFLRMTEDLPEADVLVVQFRGDRGAFPPIGRPAVTSVHVTAAEIMAISRAAAEPGLAAGEPFRAELPRGALLAAAFAEPPRMLSDLNRVIGARVDILLEDGGSVALYDVDSRTLLPRPRGVILVPRDERRRTILRSLLPVTDLVGETREVDDRIIISLDRRSLEAYLGDTMVTTAWEANRWSLRIDPSRLAPILRRAGDSTGLRLAAPRLHRSARDLREWIGALEGAKSLEAAASVRGGTEELRVRVESK